MGKFTFVLKDRGTKNQGWWLKISSIKELCAYYEQIAPTRNGKILENYLYGKDWNWAHPAHPVTTMQHAPHRQEAPITDVIVRYAANKNLTILEGIQGFQSMVASQQVDAILDSGAIYINRVGGYHSYYEGDKEYAFIHRDEIIFPDFKKEEIKVSRFPNGKHFYAHIGDLEVRDGDTIKWNTYEEAYNMALKLLEKG